MLEQMAKITHTGVMKINEYRAELEEACGKTQIWRAGGQAWGQAWGAVSHLPPGLSGPPVTSSKSAFGRR